MKYQILIMRHAKSDWSISGQRDFDRTLNTRGLSDAPRMGKFLRTKSFIPDHIMSSSSQRTTLTAEMICEQIGYEFEDIQFEDTLYDAHIAEYLKLIEQQDDMQKKIMFIGHNPTITYLVEYLADYNFSNVPTCGAVCIEFEIDSWKEISKGTGMVLWYQFPKEL